LILVMGGIATGEGACIDRPITSAKPTTKTSFTQVQQASTIDKVDLLFDIDNSASMGDKQDYLEQAVPDLITRLVSPNCSNSDGSTAGISTNGSCAMYPGAQIEFPPVHNMHIGIISSSLGTRGVTGTSDNYVCNPVDATEANTGKFLDGMPGISAHVDDRGELLNRTAGAIPAEEEGVSPDEQAEHFLDWFPVVLANQQKKATDGISPPGPALTPVALPITSVHTLEADFGLLVTGTHAYGCGIESQLETWYRFLVQPDPYDSIEVIDKHATWQNVDRTIIRQRHDFLRPDSLVAIIVLSDENDSEIDVRSLAGTGYRFMDKEYEPPRASGICASDPGSPQCVSCLVNPSDANCKIDNGVYPSEPGNDPGYYINVRHVHMQQKYGFVPQFPLQRYVLGLTSAKVPDREHEYPGSTAYTGGKYTGASSYQGGTAGDPADLNCANPLFAATLPDGSDLDPAVLCNAKAEAAARSPNLVFYAHIGGVPHELLQSKPGDKDESGNYLCDPSKAAADCPQKDTLAVGDWTRILGEGAAGGKDPYSYQGIDPHMLEAFGPRLGLANPAAPNPQGGGPDAINGREWTTDTLANGTYAHTLPVDREYACIFKLAQTRDCSAASKGLSDPVNSFACDCEKGLANGLSPEAIPAVCGLQNPNLGAQSGSNDYYTQYYAKAYPTIRELTLAEMMGTQGIISSLCPIHVTDMDNGSDALYGYRPAVGAIVNRLKKALASQCLPQPLNVLETDAGPEVSCLILATLPNTKATDEETACMRPGLKVPNAEVLTNFKEQQHLLWMADQTSTDLSTEATCEVNQISTQKTCVGEGQTEQGWCYVVGQYAGACNTQAILFTDGTPPNGATVNLQCILANAGDGGSGD
jgi:hypothetical protein